MRTNIIYLVAGASGATICSLIIFLTQLSNAIAFAVLPFILIASKLNLKGVKKYSLYKKARI